MILHLQETGENFPAQVAPASSFPKNKKSARAPRVVVFLSKKFHDHEATAACVQPARMGHVRAPERGPQRHR